MLLRSAVFLIASSVATTYAIAAPPASCAKKFIGVWQHGSSNSATLTADGRSICSGSAFCQQGTWTCDGDTATYTNSSGTFVYTLQSSGVMTYGSTVVTRISGGEAQDARKDKTGKPGRGSIGEGIQAAYQPTGAKALRRGKNIAADKAPSGLDGLDTTVWDLNENVTDTAKKLPRWNPAKKIVLKMTKANRQRLEEKAKQGASEE